MSDVLSYRVWAKTPSVQCRWRRSSGLNSFQASTLSCSGLFLDPKPRLTCSISIFRHPSRVVWASSSVLSNAILYATFWHCSSLQNYPSAYWPMFWRIATSLLRPHHRPRSECNFSFEVVLVSCRWSHSNMFWYCLLVIMWPRVTHQKHLHVLEADHQSYIYICKTIDFVFNSFLACVTCPKGNRLASWQTISKDLLSCALLTSRQNGQLTWDERSKIIY